MKGLTHPPFEAGDIADTGKEARKADLQEAPPPKVTGGNAPAIAPPSMRGSAPGGLAGGAPLSRTGGIGHRGTELLSVALPRSDSRKHVAPRPSRGLEQERFRLFPADAGVGDRRP